jgi:hypothetical protein
MPGFDCLALLRSLAQNEVEFIVVGGVGEVLQGVPSITRGLDVVCRRDSANIQRTISAMHSLDARSRVGPLAGPNPSQLHPGPYRLTTEFGPLEIRDTIGRALGYEDLTSQTDEMQVGEFRVRVLRLEKLIALKEELGRDKDLAMLPTLRATLAEKRRLELK